MYNNAGYLNYRYGRYNSRFMPNPTFYQPYYNENSNKSTETIKEDVKENTENVDTQNVVKNEHNPTRDYQSQENTANDTFRIGPLSVSQNRISIFSLNLAIDDLIIIGLAIFLLLEDSCDYLFVIILALILFDIRLSSLGDLSFLKKLNIFG